jgi:hypothetical protein
MNFKKRFRSEFGIHFKGCAGELDWALDFIEKEIKKAEKKGAEKALLNYWNANAKSHIDAREKKTKFVKVDKW